MKAITNEMIVRPNICQIGEQTMTEVVTAARQGMVSVCSPGQNRMLTREFKVPKSWSTSPDVSPTAQYRKLNL